MGRPPKIKQEEVVSNTSQQLGSFKPLTEKAFGIYTHEGQHRVVEIDYNADGDAKVNVVHETPYSEDAKTQFKILVGKHLF